MQEQEQPQSKVLTTPELLEIILLHLDTRTLLVSAQRVGKTWTVLIQGSPAIQQALFFQPTTRNPKPEKGKWHPISTWNSILPSPLEEDNRDEGSINGYKFPYLRPIYNPLLVQAFRPFFPSVHEYSYENDEKATETETETEREGKEDIFSFKPLDMLSSPQKKTAYMRKEASWRKMLLRQPPLYGGVTIFKMYCNMGGDSNICYKVPQYNPKANQEEGVHDDNEPLKMGPFLTTLIQNPDLYFGPFGQTRVYWSAYVPPYEPKPDILGGDMYPPQGGSFDPTVQEAFVRAIEKSEVVVFSRETIQCSGGGERTDEDNLREEIAEAETEGFKGVEQ